MGLIKNLSITLIITAITSAPVFAESLFAGVSQNTYYVQPRSLFGSVKAKTIGDLVTVVITQETSTSDSVSLSIQRTSNTKDNFTPLINKLLHGPSLPSVEGFGGDTSTGNKAAASRNIKFTDTITAQVVQILPNGNLVIQGKKTAVTSGEKLDIVLSGIVDPRLLDNTGKISSNLVANLQVAVVGKGTMSREEADGTINKFIKYLF